MLVRMAFLMIPMAVIITFPNLTGQLLDVCWWFHCFNVFSSLELRAAEAFSTHSYSPNMKDCGLATLFGEIVLYFAFYHIKKKFCLYRMSPM